MNKRPLPLWTLCLILFLFTSCAPKADPNAQIQQAVAATIAAIPSTTPIPTSSPYPTPTLPSLSGLFCEYDFCIGRPTFTNFFDKTALLNPEYPSTYQKGNITALSRDPLLLILIIWVHAPGTTDPQFLMDTILAKETDTQTGSLDAQLVHDMNVVSAPISTIVSPDLTTGVVAAWVCGDRVFAWKIYTRDIESAKTIFQDSIERFRCNQ
jgi:hypothetical protein